MSPDAFFTCPTIVLMCSVRKPFLTRSVSVQQVYRLDHLVNACTQRSLSQLKGSIKRWRCLVRTLPKIGPRPSPTLNSHAGFTHFSSCQLQSWLPVSAWLLHHNLVGVIRRRFPLRVLHPSAVSVFFAFAIALLTSHALEQSS